MKSCLKEVLKRRLESNGDKSRKVDEKRKNKKMKKGHDDARNIQKTNGLADGKRKKQKDKVEKEKDIKNDFEYRAADVDKVKETNVLFFQGTELSFILRD